MKKCNGYEAIEEHVEKGYVGECEICGLLVCDICENIHCT